MATERGFPAPDGALPRIGEKSLPPTGMGTGTGIEINPRAGMGMGTGVNFHPVPVPVSPLCEIPIPIPTFPSSVGEKSLFSFLFIRL